MIPQVDEGEAGAGEVVDAGTPDTGLDADVTDPPSCTGALTLPACLEVSASRRDLSRAWTTLESASLVWGEPRDVEVSVIPQVDQAELPNSLKERLSALELSTEGSGVARVTSLMIKLPAESSSAEVTLTGLRADRIFQTGYQSWSFSSAITPPDQLERDDSGHLYVQEAYTGDPLHGAHGVSFGLIGGQLGSSDAGGAWLLGHLDPTYAITALGAEVDDSDERVRVVARIGFDDVALRDQRDSASPDATSGEIHQELTLITAPTMWLALRAYQSALAERLELLRASSVRSTSSRAEPLRPPRGWYSWNERFEEIDEAYIMAHVERVADRLKPLGFDLVELDDGWQRGWGEWLTNEHFPQGFDAIVNSARERDVTLGIWLAPFLVDVEVATRLDYPRSWFVYPPLEAGATLSERDRVKPSEAELAALEESGAGAEALEPLRHRIIGNPRTYYVIDTTHPDALTHTLTQLSALASQGFKLFKLDFLYAAAIPGRRAQEISGTESLRLGLSQIRDAIGEEAWINACGAPVHPVLGYADSLRIGSDTTFGELYPSFIASAARSSAARAYLYPLVWSDGDQVQLRSPYTPLEAEVGAYVAALAGPAYSIGDDLTLLPDDRLELFLDEGPRWWAELEVPAIPLDLMATPASEWLGNPLTDHLRAPGSTSAPPPSLYLGYAQGDQWRLLNFNWSAEGSSSSSELSVSWERLGE